VHHVSQAGASLAYDQAVMPASFWLQGSQYDHLLQHPAAEASDTEAPSEADGAAAPEPASAAGDTVPGQAGSWAAAGGGGGGGSAADAAADVHLHLSCQKFVELVRESRIDEAVAFGRKVGNLCVIEQFLFWLSTAL
jgi:hypothetical protein